MEYALECRVYITGVPNYCELYLFRGYIKKEIASLVNVYNVTQSGSCMLLVRSDVRIKWLPVQ